ncbi:kinase-like protein [Auricularia subglabra TFB-10046 SS5]|nr:kinase-like protein [Auricularia subglabra TFB-10046 SS5]
MTSASALEFKVIACCSESPPSVSILGEEPLRGHLGTVRKGSIAIGGKEKAVAPWCLAEEYDWGGAQLDKHEEHTWRRLAHRNLVPLLCVCWIEPAILGKTAIVVPYMEYGNLTMYVKNNGDCDRLSLMTDAADGLLYLHDVVMIAHGNVKPENILIGSNGRAVLSDLRASTSVAFKPGSLDRIEFNPDSLPYHAPEIFDNSVAYPSRPGIRRSRTTLSDIYAYGMVLYEIHGGRLPQTVDECLDEKRELSLDESMCLSVLPATLSDQAREAQKFQIDNLRRIDHDKFLKFWDTCILGPDQVGLVMTHMYFGTLARYLRHEPNALRLPLVVDVVQGVAYLHEKGFVHGDIHPSKIFVSYARKAFLSAYTVSPSGSSLGATSEQFRQRRAGGEAYNAPELSEDRASKASDMYSFGALVCEHVKREQHMWGGLSHRNILELFGVCEIAGFPQMPQIALISPFMERGNLGDYLKKNPQCDRLSLMTDCASGLLYLHDTAKVVHGDLKMANVLIDDEEHALLADFGLSTTVLPGLEPSNEQRRAIFSLPYCAPELIDQKAVYQEDPGTVWSKTTMSDMYAFAMLIYAVRHSPIDPRGI